MTNIEKVKRILDAGHWVKATSKKFTITITSYNKNEFTYLHDGSIHISTYNFNNYTIEVIQRIPTPYVAGDKVLVLSNPSPDNIYKEDMVGKVGEIFYFNNDGSGYTVWNEDKSNNWIFPSHCLSPTFDDEPTLSGKEVTVTIDGKEYTCVLK